MKKILLGFIVGVVTATGVSVMANGLIQKAEFNDVGVRFNGEQLELNQQLLSVQVQGNDNVSNYMPVRDVLEGMGYTVDWNGGSNMIEISNKTEVNNINTNSDSAIISEWISIDDLEKIYGYDVARGSIGVGIYDDNSSIDGSVIFYSFFGVDDNQVRLLEDNNQVKFNRQDLLDLGIDLTPKE